MEYKWVDWTFNTDLWSKTIARAIELYGKDDFAEICGLSDTTVYNWSVGRYTEGFNWPSMHNFLKITNLLDLNPMKFFVLESENHDNP